MRTIRLDDDRHDNTLLWLGTGAAVGLVVGVLAAERLSGKRLTLEALVSGGQRIAKRAIRQWGPLMESVGSLRELWEGVGRPEAAEFAWSEDDEGEEEDDSWEGEEDEEEGDEGAEDDLAADTLADDDLADDPLAIDARVLEAFMNDPILSRRALEIEEADDGRILLHGTVRSAREVKYAVTLARGVPGVQRVGQRLGIGG